ncbi:MAG: ABC transporter permease subunit [Myxococcales bacterium]|nr:ABC transporter permease subunit [Myxococcales bacterium]
MLAAATEAHAGEETQDPGLRRVTTTKTFRWGGDVQGGEPFVHENAKGERVGFEVEVADGIAKRLGAKAVFVQNDWSALVPALDRGTFDVILNGFEMTASRVPRVLYTRPYKTYASRLMTRANAPLAPTRDAMKGKRIGSLAGTRSFEIVREAGAVPVPYEGCLEPYIDLENGRIDGVLLDDLIAVRYSAGKKSLVVSGDVEPGFYAVATRRSEPGLRDAVDAALGDMITKGELRDILARAKLLEPRDEKLMTWDAPAQAAALGQPPPASATSLDGGADAGALPPPAPESTTPAPEGPEPVFDLPRLVLLLRAALVTLTLSLAGMALAAPLGLALACLRTYGGRPVSAMATTYVEVMRGTPLLLQLYLLYFGLAPWVKLPAPFAAVLALGLNYAAYEAEAYRAGIQAVPEGHTEAGLALGLSRFRVVRSVVVPQAVRLALPNVTSDFVSLLKDSSLVSVITVVELTKQMSITAVDVRSWSGPGLACALLYLSMSYPLARLARRFEARASRKSRPEAKP